MSHLFIQRLSRLLLALLVLFTAGACAKEQVATTRDFDLADLLITIDEMPAGWRIEFPADHITGFYYPEEAVKIVFVPETGVRRATVQYIDRFSGSKEAKFRLHNNYIPEGLNSGEFVPAGWVHPTLSADEGKFVCYWKAVDVDPEKFMLCEWTARYDEFIVDFVSWVLPDLMSLDQIKAIIVEIDRKMMEQLGN